MTTLHVEIKENWTAFWKNHSTSTYTGALLDRLSQLEDDIKIHEVHAGTISQEVPFEKDDTAVELSQYLTESTNLPFVIGQPEEFEEKVAQLPWEIIYHGYHPGKDEYSVESLLTVGNGFMGLRGTTPEMEISNQNYPALYLASLYDRAPSQVAERTIYNEDFVNAPNLQKIYLVIDNERIDVATNEIIQMKRRLNLKTGLFESWVTYRLKNGKEIAVHSQKIANMADSHQYNIRYSFTPVNFSGEINVISEADGAVYNYNVERYRSLEQNHITVSNTTGSNHYASLEAKTIHSHITILQQSQLKSDNLDLTDLKTTKDDQKVWQKLTVQTKQETTYSLEKSVIVHQARPNEQTPEEKPTFQNFEESYADSKNAWEKLWEQAGISVKGDLMSQKLLNLHTYHLLSSASPFANPTLDASITARGLHGEAYRGHIFWDELFIFPFYILHFPETAKSLLMYRYRRLETAKEDAQKAGYEGAMFPWQSGLDGSEQSQELHLNPINGTWKEDNSRLQRHVSLAIAYNIWQYWHNTQDTTFMQDYGLEMLLEIAHFWQSATVLNNTSERYDIDRVMGPDEFHESYPNSEKGGLKNNAYTNMMVVWLFEEIENLKNQFAPETFKTVQEKTEVSDELLETMALIKHQLALEINEDGIIAQFEGYFDLKDLDWDHYRKEYGNIYRMDRILNAEGKSADAYKVSKQADSLMIFYNFGKDQVDTILDDLNYQLPEDYVTSNLHYYLARTSHGSTLSRVVHAQLAAMVDNQKLAWDLYQEALYSDYRDIQGGTTAEGIHAGVMAATLYIPLTTFAGLDIRGPIVSFKPNLPNAWTSIAFKFKSRGVNFSVLVEPNKLTLTADKEITIAANKKEVLLTANTPKEIAY
ncbi:MAG TPA: glycoside hydrolase family 65 protein [Candidatus Tetragenococcus pullicola]|nr:glycoside hydrolase family 65 protein [Candidatus Tetragenococcus pullicola]